VKKAAVIEVAGTDANPIINKIKDKSYYDIKLHSNDGKYIILRYENMINNKFKVIYID